MLYQDFLRENENKLEDKLIQSENNFDFFRFISACMVLFSHSFILLKSNFIEPLNVLTNGALWFGGIGVNIFFLISGFLVTKSYQTSHGILNYLKKRFLRIYPALFVMFFLILFVLGPLVTTLTWHQYFSSPLFFKFFCNFIMYLHAPTLPGVFVSNTTAYGHIVNGSIWTLSIEIICYLFVMLVGLLSFFKKRRLLFPLIFFLMLWEFVFCRKGLMELLSILHLVTYVHFRALQDYRLYIFFLIGMLLYLYKDKIVLNKYIALLALIASLLIIKGQNTSLIYYSHYILLPYLVMYAAFNFKFLNHFGKYGDFSYGIYIYAWPIQQVLILYFGKYLNPYTLALSAFFIVMIFAVLSWNLVEKPCLRLKNVNITESIKNMFSEIFKSK